MSLLFAFIPLGSVFAEVIESPKPYDFKNGLLDDPNIYTGLNPSTDNNTSTYLGICGTCDSTINFKLPVYIDQMYLKSDSKSTSRSVVITFDNGETYTKNFDNLTTGYFDIGLDNVIKVSIESSSAATINLYEIDFFGSYEIETTSLESIKDLEVYKSYNSVSLSWTNPDNESFEGVIIKKNSEKIVELPKDSRNHTIQGLEPDTEYNFEVITKYADGGLSEPVKKTIRTDKAPESPPLDEVENVEIKAKHDRVDLSWNLPQSEGFHHVNIYRDKIEDPSLLKRIFSGGVAYAASTPIFETNGTYFNDLTVEPKTKYEYTLKTTDGKVESEGVTVQVETPKAPPPEMGGIEGEKQENGDYLFTWGEPTDGEVKIIVGGKEYATVPAGDKSFTVPAKDMKYTGLGDPDVSLKPISPTGEEGEATPIKPEFETPFDVKDLLETGTGLLLIIGPFLLLALSFLLVPKLRNLIVNAFKSKKGEDGKTRESRETRVPRNERRTG